MPQRTRIGVAATAIALGSLLLPAGFAAAGEPDDCLAAGNVWVVVEHDNGITGGCATEFGDGFEALTSAGVPFAADGGFTTTIDGEPQTAGAEDWWSYWTATPDADGGLAWESYSVGAVDSQPKAGTVEGWRLAHSFTEDAPPPSAQQLADVPAAADTAAEEPAAEAGSAMGVLIGAVGALVAVAAGIAVWLRRRRTA